jgi:hypothetical protein
MEPSVDKEDRFYDSVDEAPSSKEDLGHQRNTDGPAKVNATTNKIMDKTLSVVRPDQPNSKHPSSHTANGDKNNKEDNPTSSKEDKRSHRRHHIKVGLDVNDLKQTLKNRMLDDPKARAKRRPYYLHGKYKFLNGPRDPRKSLIRNLNTERYQAIYPNVTTWSLPLPLQQPTRNHDSVIIEGGYDGQQPILVTLLGRYSRYIQSMDLITGRQWLSRTKGKDPSGNPIDDLNHVTGVLVDNLKGNGQEIWLPCGFHNDQVNKEMSTDYVRIVDAKTMKVRVGPKLPVAGGACISKALTIIPNEPPMICSFAGTQGNHDRGTFLPHTQCYDRIREKWWRPFGNLPYGLDHGSLAVVPAGTCHSKDPARVLIFNFRTEPYGNPHPEFLAHDIPNEGWSIETLIKYEEKVPAEWFVYHNVTDTSPLKDIPRDASGVVTANNGRYILNFGGTYRTRSHTRGNGKSTKKGRTSMIRSFDVCRKEWKVIGDLGLQTFALQTAASDSLGVAVTCGGEAPLAYSNSPFCFVSRWENMTISNPQINVLGSMMESKKPARKRID